MIRLVDVDPDNWRLKLEVSEDQRRFVSSTAGMLARAYAYRNFRSRAFLICDGERPIGMGLYYDEPGMPRYNLSQFLIDRRFQRRGYGKEATRMVLDQLKRDGRFDSVCVCYVEGNEAARKLYEGFGFREILRDEDEIVMELCFGPRKSFF